MRLLLYLCLLFVLVSGAMARAEAVVSREQARPTRRVAVVVGANAAVLGRAALRYAHEDARRMMDVLLQVGEFAPGDVELLLDPTPEALLTALDQKLEQLRGASGQTLLLFYYSGHADQLSLYPGGAPLALAAVKQRIESASATVRLGIIDACRGGGWTQAKGLHADAEPFALRVPLEVQSTGSVLIASSSGLENAHETAALEGSFFTHHLVAGLRGAADVAGDGEVSLIEAFTYAKQFTIRDTALFADRLQHPSFDMNLRGREDLALTRVETGGSIVVLRQRKGPLEVVQASTGRSVLELAGGERQMKLALRPGRYLLIRKDASAPAVQEFSVQPEQSLLVDEEGLVPASFASIASKGATETGALFPRDAPRRVVMFHPLELGFAVLLHLEWVMALDSSWALAVEPSGWKEDGTQSLLGLGLEVGARYHVSGNAPEGAFVGARVGSHVAQVRGVFVGGDETFVTLNVGLDVGYTLLFWNRLALSLGLKADHSFATQRGMRDSISANRLEEYFEGRGPREGFSAGYRVGVGFAF
ncbi:caspase family protein [Myxococcus landrumensis]|uniref:Caspase family protein n=1 Tax=Myxococcus landrumensis TaxID=2813577 RepID=A0ABX7NGW4_9BACT|nr:caspase family protein [Myxococcus landrumus]QSQ17619.1 caspase family protein [Myxococcus landrumus]